MVSLNVNGVDQEFDGDDGFSMLEDLLGLANGRGAHADMVFGVGTAGNGIRAGRMN